MLLYDPRYERKIKTNNPAIILADKVVKSGILEPDKDFWDTIKRLANYADFDVKPEKKNMV
jgi:hypothetical protein